MDDNKCQLSRVQDGRARNGVYRLQGYEAICNYRHEAWYGTPGLPREEAEFELRRHREREHGTFPGGAR